MDKKLCARCILPESPPEIIFDNDGICNICRDFEEHGQLEKKEKLQETDFVRMIQKHKKKAKGPYHCLVMLSGGKDSTSSLYYMKNRYGLNPLAFTFDHGFENHDAMENINKAVAKLGVDFLYFKTSYMNEMFSDIVNYHPQVVICHPCSLWYMSLSFEMAARYGIPMIIAGWTKGQYSQNAQDTGKNKGQNLEFQKMSGETGAFLENYCKKNQKYKDFPKNMDEVIKKANKKHKAVVLSPHWFLPFGPEVYLKLIQEKLGWKPPKHSYPANSTNCHLNYLSVENSLCHYGYTHYHIEMSKLIRQGFLTRQEALSALEFTPEKEIMAQVLDTLNMKN